jgi:hypothetical protein
MGRTSPVAGAVRPARQGPAAGGLGGRSVPGPRPACQSPRRYGAGAPKALVPPVALPA